MSRSLLLPGLLAGALLLGSASLAGCTTAGKASGEASSSSPSSTSPSSTSPSAQPTGLGGGAGEQSSAARSTVISTPRPSLSTPHGVPEVDGVCPYITNDAFADAEGDRVGRVTVLQTKPVGCRFYFQYDDTVVVGEIDRETFATPTQAYNAMVLSAKGHPEVQSDPTIGDGAVAFQSMLQGTDAWQCVFAKGTSVVTVRTRQPYPALNALNLAREIAPKIT